jgi:hypothetical protein
MITKSKNKNKIAIWITWERQRRNREIGKRLGVFVYEWDYIDKIKNRLKKYIRGLLETTFLLFKVKPHIVFCQNPSIILSLFVCIIGKIFSFQVIVDTHNAGLFPLEGRYKVLLKISKIIQRHAFLNIVTNKALKDYVEKNGGRAFILPDPIPEFSGAIVRSFEHPFTILFICSFADDEPYENVFSAAGIIGNLYHFYVTGNYKKKSIDPKLIPRNVTLLGYISENEYVNMIHSVDITIDLTDRENCLLCGAYESVAAEKPMVISNTEALREYFHKGAVYTGNTARDITLSIKDAQKEIVRLNREIQQLKIEKQGEWIE